MNVWSLVSSVALLHLLAISSPGPTFMVISRCAIAGDRTAALLVAVGVVLATLTWSAFAATGLGTLAARYPLAFATIQLAGAGYLIYLGATLLIDLLRGPSKSPDFGRPSSGHMRGWRAIAAGYLTNIANPKVVAYYTSLFGVVLPADPGVDEFFLVVATIVLVSALWWAVVALIFTLEVIQRRFALVHRWIEGTMGLLLIGFGMKLILSR